VKSSSFLNRHRADFIAVVLAGLWLVFWRAILGTPWSPERITASGGLLETGILYNSTDTWSYLSWVQQYHHGAGLAGLLYTTEPHSALLWLFPLWIVGQTAAWTAFPVIGVYNVAGLFGAMATVCLFRHAARALSLPSSACNWATLALVTGSGGSWLWHLAHKLHLAPPANGGDLFFFDLFPSTAFLAYSYHAMGLALLAGLWWTSTETETRLSSGEKPGRWIVAMIGFALLLGFSRPYEPVAFMGAWGLKTAWHYLNRRSEPLAWKPAVQVSFLLAAALIPGIGWTGWVSRQPVWATFANQSLTLGLSRTAWLWTLLGWGILAAIGAPSAWRSDRRLAILPLTATGLLAAILIGLGSSYTKLSSGLTYGPIFLAGWGAVRLVAVTVRLPKLIQVPLVGLGLGALLGCASFYMAVNTITLNGSTLIESDLARLAGQLPHISGNAPVTVLTDGDTGTILPGLVGARVWVGHWSLSPHYKEKIARLREAGLDPQHPPSDTAAAQVALDAILADSRFDYALFDHRCRGPIDWLSAHGWEPVSTTPTWVLLQPASILRPHAQPRID